MDWYKIKKERKEGRDLFSFSWLYLFLSSVWESSSSILFSNFASGIVVNAFFRLFESWKVFLSPSTTADSFAGNRNLVWQLWYFRTWNVLP